MRPATISGQDHTVVPTRATADALWIRTFRWGLLLSGGFAVVAGGIGFMTSSWFGLMSTSLGIALVSLLCASTALVIHALRNASPKVASGSAFLVYVLKIAACVVLLAGLPPHPWLMQAAFFFSAVVTLLLWQALTLILFARRRQVWAVSSELHE